MEILEVKMVGQGESGSLNAQLFNELAAHGLIRETERFCAAELPQSIVFDTKGEALAFLVENGVLSKARLEALREQQQTLLEDTGTAERIRALEEASALIHELQACREEKHRASTSSLGRRSVGSLLLVCGLTAGYYVYHQFVNSVPGCDAPVTRKAIWSMIAGIPRGLDSGGAAPASMLSQVKEIGYASAHRQRGCTATLNYDGETIPYAYVIGPAAGKAEEMEVGGAHRAIVEARFARIGDDGDFLNKAEPIGRSQVMSAIRSAAEEMAPARPPLMPSVQQTVNALFRPINSERLREIADVEPIGQCRTVQARRRYSCRVLVERNDPLMSIFGMRAEVLDAEFTFVRDADTGPWRMSEDFKASLARAISNARLASLKRKPGT